MYTILEIIQIILAAILVLLVLVHSAKGEGLGSIGGSAQMFKSSSKVEKGLNYFTWGIVVLFLGISATLGWDLVTN